MDIELRPRLTKAELQAYIDRQQPVVITDVATHWPSAETWTFDRLRERGADPVVQVEYGNAVLQQDFRLGSTHLNEYLDMIEDGRAETNRVYLAMFSLFDAIPGTADDVHFDELFPKKRVYYNKAWIGPRGTGSGFHQDFGDNILCQVVGRKLVRLVPRSQDAQIYVSRRYDFLCRLSDVDPDTWSADDQPAYRDADVGEVVLEPGWMIYIPTRWWHSTRALDNSISVNWGGLGIGEIVRASPWLGLELLHRLHLYRWGDCNCHIADPATGEITVRR